MRHIIAISGGQDSAALAVFMRKTYPALPLELVFADTGRELPDTYRFVNDLEDYLGTVVHRVNDYDRDFDYYLDRWNYFLPGNASRWCTKHLKIRPFERFVGKKVRGRFERDATIYIGLRADEQDREGNYGIEGVVYRYPLQEHGIDKNGVKEILRCTDLVLPDYYEWRSTGGCWMCPWQRDSDWRALNQRYPELVAQAIEEERRASLASANPANSQSVTWSVTHRGIKDIVSQKEMFPITRDKDRAPCLICAK